jgi:hypothetical protein
MALLSVGPPYALAAAATAESPSQAGLSAMASRARSQRSSSGP